VAGSYKTISALVSDADAVYADSQGVATITPSRLRQFTEDSIATLAPTETTLTFSTSLSWALDTNPVASVTLTGGPTTITLSAGQAGRTYRLAAIQDGAGNRAVTLAGCTVLGSPVWATAAGGTNLISVDVVGSTRFVVVS
jgi:hypothetical protein